MDEGGKDTFNGTSRWRVAFDDAGDVDERYSDLISSEIERDLLGDTNEGESPSMGRYTLVSRIGAGGLGIVYQAHDPTLGRDVAIKVVAGKDVSDEEKQRHLDEARALARVSHPNVVQVHDAEIHDGEVYLVLELVKGRTLNAWLKSLETSPGKRWREILPVFMDAGRGLAAVHAQNLVHRDFKPENVLVGDDSSVRVIDLGLARASEDAAVDPRDQETLDGESGQELASRGRARLTRTGHVNGTPLYMAPEQWSMECDERSDQFSFCVALFEALYEAHPFPANDLTTLARAIRKAEPELPKNAPRIPRRIKRAILRGLAKRPDDRFPDMPALLEELDVFRSAGSRASALASVAMLALGVGLTLLISASDDEDPCAWAGESVASLWSEERIASWQRIVDAGQFSGNWDALRTRLDRYTGELASARLQVCRAARVEERLSAAQVRDQDMCLERRVNALDAITTPPAADDKASIAAKVLAAFEQAQSSTISECLALPSTGADQDDMDPAAAMGADAEGAGPVAAMVQEMVAVEMHHRAGDREASRARAEELVTRIESAIATASERDGKRSSRHQRLLSEALYRLGVMQLSDEDWQRAQETLDRALYIARSQGDQDLWLETELMLTLLAWRHHDDTALGLQWAMGADADSQRLNAWTRYARAQEQHGMLLARDGHLEEAERLQREAVAITRSYSTRTITLANQLQNLANTLAASPDKRAEARTLFDEAWALMQKTIGASHPASARLLWDMGRFHRRYGDIELAYEYLRAAVEVWSSVYSCDPEDESDTFGCTRMLASTLHELALTERKLGLRDNDPERFVAAYQHTRQSLDILEHLPETNSRGLLIAARHESLGILGFYDGRYQDSAEHYRRALDMRERLLGADHAHTLKSHVGLGEALVESRAYEQALVHFDHAAAHEDALGDDVVWRGVLYQGRGLALLGLGRSQEALLAMERARTLLDGADAPEELADVLFGLARALEAARQGTPESRRQLAERALALYSDNTAHFLAQKRAVEDWLAKRP